MSINYKTPDYFQEFACLGGDCEDTCCKDWDIRLDRHHYEALRDKMSADTEEKAIFEQFIKLNQRPVMGEHDYAHIQMAGNGMCPMLAVTNSAINAVAMGGATFFVLVGSSFLVSSFRKLIPKQVRISCFIIIIATFVTIADYSLLALVPKVHKELGAFIPLIVANCLILGRQEAFASRYPTRLAVLDALGMASGFMLALFSLGAVREILGHDPKEKLQILLLGPARKDGKNRGYRQWRIPSGSPAWPRRLRDR